MEKLWIWLPAASLAVLFAFIVGCGDDGDGGNAGPEPVPAEIQGIFDKPAYRNASWALRVVDLDSGRIIHDVNSGRPRLIASVRKLFSVGVAPKPSAPITSFVPPCTGRGRSAAPASSPET